MFEPNDHSKWQVTWKAVPHNVIADVSELLKNFYPVLRVDSVRQVNEWEQSSNNYMVLGETSEGRVVYLVRRNIAKSHEKVIHSSRIMEGLSGAGAMVPDFIINIEGEAVTSHRGLDWQVFKFIPGDHYRGEESQLAQAARGVARLHKKMELIVDKSSLGDLSCSFGHFSVAWWKLAIEQRAQNGFEQMLHERFSFFCNIVERVQEKLGSVQTSDGVIHGDIHPQNFIFQGDRLAAIIDFENIARADIIYDVATACHRLVRQHVVFSGKPWPEVLPNGISIFLREYLGENKLADEKIRMLPVFAQELLLRKMAYNYSLYKLKKRNHQVCQAQYEKFFILLSEAEAISEAMS